MSRILDSGPHTVVVFPEETTTDSYGNTVRRPSTVGVTVTGCQVTPLSSSRGAFSSYDLAEGQQVDQYWQIRARNAPLGNWSRIEWNGLRLSPLGAPLHHTIRGVAHVACSLQEER